MGGLHNASVTELNFGAEPLAQNYACNALIEFTDRENGEPIEDQGWDIDLGIITLRVEQTGFWVQAQNNQIAGGLSGVFSFFPNAAPEDYESPRLLLSADHPMQDADNPQGWLFEGQLYQGTRINLTELVKQFLGLGRTPASVPDLVVDRLDISFATGDKSYALDGRISTRWTPELFGTPLKISAAADIGIARSGDAPEGTPASGHLSAEFAINRIAVEMALDIGVEEPTYLLKVCVDTLWVQAITAWRGEQHSRHQVISVQLGGTTLGDMLEYLVNLAAPTQGFELDAPWDVL
ncbi:hypothetical protein D3C77_386410 [compost metagenome]